MSDETRRNKAIDATREAGAKGLDSAMDWFAWAKDNPADAAFSSAVVFVLGVMLGANVF